MDQDAVRRKGWGPDIAAGAIVALVALPLCLGIALASGAPLASGLITGIVGGLVVSWLGGTQLLVSGPAAGLAAIVLVAIADLGSFEAFLAAVVIAGLMQLGLGLAKAGKLAALVPSQVVTGMLAAIGVLLILQQLPYALGVKPDSSIHGIWLFKGVIDAVWAATPGASLVGLSGLALLFMWELPLLTPLRKRVPGPLVAVGFGTALAAALDFVPGMALAPAMYVILPEGGVGLTFPELGAFGEMTTWRVAVTLAIVGSIETLLSMEATDRMDPLKRTSDGNRELVGQGVGNFIAGLIGGLPMTGVIVRSAANIEAGGRTWRSAFVHGVVLFAAVLAVPFLLEYIPLAALAAVLLHTGYKLAHPSRFRAAVYIGLPYAVPLFGTVLVVVVTDLLVGVGFGLVLCLLVALASAARNGAEIEQPQGGLGRIEVRLSRAVSFLHKPQLRELFDGLPVGAAVTVDGSRTREFDHDVVEYLHSFAEGAPDRGIDVHLIGVPAPRIARAH